MTQRPHVGLLVTCLADLFRPQIGFAAAKLLDQAVEAWEMGTPAGRREAFRKARALISALDLPAGAPPEELAEEAARKTRRKPQQDALLAILRELPEEKGGTAAIKDALRFLLEHGNDGTVALVTATAPPAGVDLLEEIGKKGLVLKEVGTAVRQQLPPGAYLELFVKVDKDWQRHAKALERLGY